jgi:hypothetical protein
MPHRTVVVAFGLGALLGGITVAVAMFGWAQPAGSPTPGGEQQETRVPATVDPGRDVARNPAEPAETTGGGPSPNPGDVASSSGATADSHAVRRFGRDVPWPRMPAGSGVITGTVATESGEPVSGAIIHLVQVRPGVGGRRDRFEPEPETVTRRPTTGADGRYRVDGVPAGIRLAIFARAEGYSIRQSAAKPVDVVPGATVDFVAREMATLTIDLRRPDGTPPRAATIRRDENRSSSGFGWIPEDPILQLSPGDHVLVVTTRDGAFGGRKTIDAGPGPQTVTIDLSPLPGLRVEIDTSALGPFADEARVRVRAVADGVVLPTDAVELAAFFESYRNPTVARFPGSTEAWIYSDLPPGRYAVAVGLSAGTAVVAHTIVDVGDHQQTVRLAAGPMPRWACIAVTLVGPGGGPVTDDEVQFSVRREGSTGAAMGGRADCVIDGTHMLIISPYMSRSEIPDFFVSATSAELGATPEVGVQLGPAPAVTLRFKPSGSLDLSIAGLEQLSAAERRGVLVSIVPWTEPEAGRAVRLPVAPARDDRQAQPEMSVPALPVGRHLVVVWLNRSTGTSSGPMRWAMRLVTISAGENRVDVALPRIEELTLTTAARLFILYIWRRFDGHPDARLAQLPATEVAGFQLPPGTTTVRLPRGRYEITSRFMRDGQWVNDRRDLVVDGPVSLDLSP